MLYKTLNLLASLQGEQDNVSCSYSTSLLDSLLN